MESQHSEPADTNDGYRRNFDEAHRQLAAAMIHLSKMPKTTPDGLDPEFAASRLVSLEIDARKHGQVASPLPPWLVFHLGHIYFRSLDIHLQADHWTDEVRCDYFESSQQFVLRWNSKPHELLEDLPKRSAIAVTSRLKSISDIFSNRHDPDIALGHPSARYPGVIIEVAGSEKGNALEQLANEYLCHSGGQIRLMVGIKTEFSDEKGNKSKKARFSVWKPLSTTQDGTQSIHAVCTASEVMFRNEEGVPNLDAELRFSLSDFAAPAVIKRSDLSSTTLSPSLPLSFVRVSRNQKSSRPPRIELEEP
ncbi:hypothetical protein AYO21_04602 [Fonsecaea monophora]|uniref:Uncharacterized protein n=1 Tax=Fonsecaea monophora TaxID=254056 RepID=A0A177FCP2_9EURO|nr:hypothetical protein AYO21_04602 [Fonsecaea monophora]KAH0837141.1 hypothetical protein FOPE_04752 [Fonsecaea pedrosoi]OAG41222.1 hypothetical protein AYO21_04602 [Fonsecaea monophora]